MFPLILLAVLGQAPTVDEWRPYTANPKYEVLGHMEQGVFRYARSRPVATNYGLNLPKHEPILAANDFEVRGTDPQLGKELAGVAYKAEPHKAGQDDATVGAIISDAAGPCPPNLPCPPNGPCPSPRPAPRPPVVPPALERDALIVVGLVAVGAIAVFGVLAVFLVGAFYACRALFRLLTPDRV